MDMRKYVPAMMLEHWIYVLAFVNSVVIITLLYAVRAPIHFGIW
jgi:hypothetical protein